MSTPVLMKKGKVKVTAVPSKKMKPILLVSPKGLLLALLQFLW